MQERVHKQNEKEKSAHRLQNGNQSKWKMFRAEHKIYREEENEIQSMVSLIKLRGKGRNREGTNVIIKHLKIGVIYKISL